VLCVCVCAVVRVVSCVSCGGPHSHDWSGAQRFEAGEYSHHGRGPHLHDGLRHLQGGPARQGRPHRHLLRHPRVPRYRHRTTHTAHDTRNT
jgi:hypothetical protein